MYSPPRKQPRTDFPEDSEQSSQVSLGSSSSEEESEPSFVWTEMDSTLSGDFGCTTLRTAASSEEEVNGEGLNYEEGDWSNLPKAVLEQIFSYLDMKNRSEASVVCRNWRPVFFYPSMWRCQKFRFTKAKYTSYGDLVQRVIERYGNMMKSVDVSFKRPRSNLGGLQHKVSAFLCLMSRYCQLDFFKMDKVSSRHLPQGPCKIFESVIKFLRSQRNLKTVSFNCVHVTQRMGVELLRVLDGSIEKLFINRLFLPDMERVIHRNTEFLEVFAKFTNLSALSLSYGCLSEDIMKELAVSLRGKLKELEINLVLKNLVGLPRPVLTEKAWSNLVQKCPGLAVHFQLCMFDATDARPFLPASIPLRYFTFVIYSYVTQEQFTSIFEYLQNHFRESLEYLKVNIRGYVARDAGLPITKFAEACVKLRKIIIRTYFLIIGYEHLWDSVASNRCRSLQRMKIKFKKYWSVRQKYTFLALRPKYVKLLQGNPVSVAI